MNKILITLLLLAAGSLSADWASDRLAMMSLEQKIGQLFIGAVYPLQQDADREGRSDETRSYENRFVSDFHVGGVFLKSVWDWEQERERIEQLQNSAGAIPLFVAQDFECGLGGRIRNATQFPKNMTLGAITDDRLLEAMGQVVGDQARSIGVNLVLAPVVDVNTNPLNPVIHLRSFGENPKRVAQKGVALMRGLQESGVLACAKHFPGHGDSSLDSHIQLPFLALSRARLEDVEWVPFHALIDAGVTAVMSAHLAVPALDPTGTPASLSRPIIEGVLRHEWGFNGLVITDDLLMDAIGKHFGVGEACKLALMAGNDLIMTSNGVPEGMHCIREAVLTGEIAEATIDQHVLRILRVKQSLGTPYPISTKREASDAVEKIQASLYRRSLTLLENRQCVPIDPQGLNQWAFVQVGGHGIEPFWNRLDPNHEVFSIESQGECPVLSQQIIAAFYPSNCGIIPGQDSLMPDSDDRLRQLWDHSQALLASCREKGVPLILLWFGSPYGLREVAPADALLLAFEDAIEAQNVAAEALVGSYPIQGMLPVTINPSYVEGDGLDSRGL